MTVAARQRTLRGREGTEIAKRRWEIDLEGRTRVVELEHGYISGRCRVRVDGQTVLDRAPRSIGDWFVLTTRAEHQFAIDGHPCALRVESDRHDYAFDLIVDGISQRTLRLATRPPWETPRPRAVRIAAALLLLTAAVVGLPPLVLAFAGPLIVSPIVVSGVVLIVLLVLAAWGVRARVRQAWWVALAATLGFALSLLVGFAFALGSEGYDDPVYARLPFTDLAAGYAILAWVVLTVLLDLVTGVVLLSRSVRRTLTFAAPAPLGFLGREEAGAA